MTEPQNANLQEQQCGVRSSKVAHAGCQWLLSRRHAKGGEVPATPLLLWQALHSSRHTVCSLLIILNIIYQYQICRGKHWYRFTRIPAKWSQPTPNLELSDVPVAWKLASFSTSFLRRLHSRLPNTSPPSSFLQHQPTFNAPNYRYVKVLIRLQLQSRSMSTTPLLSRKRKRAHPYLSGNFAPIQNTVPLMPCSYSGVIPEEVWGGEYVRNGGTRVFNHPPSNC